MDWIVQEAHRTGTSIEEVARGLLYRGLAVETGSAASVLYHDLDDLAGTWSSGEAQEFHQAIAEMDQVDPSLWQ